MSGGENQKVPEIPPTAKSTRSAYQSQYYQRNKERLDAKRELRRQRTPRSCISCHNPFTPTYARQKLCAICAAALNERFIPADASPEELKIFESVSKIEPKKRRALSSGFAKKKHIIENMLRTTVAMYTQEAEAASWRLQYYEEVAKHVRGARKEQAQASVAEAQALMQEAALKLGRAQRNLEIHHTLQNDGKYFDKDSGAVIRSQSDAVPTADLSPEDNYRQLLAEFEKEELLDVE